MADRLKMPRLSMQLCWWGYTAYVSPNLRRAWCSTHISSRTASVQVGLESTRELHWMKMKEDKISFFGCYVTIGQPTTLFSGRSQSAWLVSLLLCGRERKEAIPAFNPRASTLIWSVTKPPAHIKNVDGERITIASADYKRIDHL